jgi:isochorismate pyruvate lyase
MLRLILVAAALVVAYRAAKAQNDSADPPAYWGKPSVDGGKCCETLAEVRENIDRIDRQILTLMAERGKYVVEAGRFKASPAAVSDPARVEAILAKVRKIAAEDGLSPEVAERTYRAMIAAFTDYEREDWIKRNASGAPAPAK